MCVLEKCWFEYQIMWRRHDNKYRPFVSVGFVLGLCACEWKYAFIIINQQPKKTHTQTRSHRSRAHPIRQSQPKSSRCHAEDDITTIIHRAACVAMHARILSDMYTCAFFPSIGGSASGYAEFKYTHSFSINVGFFVCVCECVVCLVCCINVLIISVRKSHSVCVCFVWSWARSHPFAFFLVWSLMCVCVYRNRSDQQRSRKCSWGWKWAMC